MHNTLHPTHFLAQTVNVLVTGFKDGLRPWFPTWGPHPPQGGARDHRGYAEHWHYQEDPRSLEKLLKEQVVIYTELQRHQLSVRC